MILAESLLDAIVMEDSQSNRHLANPAGTNESDWSETFYQSDDLLNQVITAETGYRCPGR